MRSGVIAEKLGMSRFYAEDGRSLPVTILQVSDLHLVGLRTPEVDSYAAVVLGSGRRKDSRTAKPQREAFRKIGMSPKSRLCEFRVNPEAIEGLRGEIGQAVGAHQFAVGQYVDVRGFSKGKGFQGGMKRHGFKGLRASHGVSVSHRSLGSTGQCQDPGRTFKGKKMAGHMGAENVCIQNLEVVRVDAERGWLILAGSVPGPRGGWVTIVDAARVPAPDAPALCFLRDFLDQSQEAQA